MKFYDFVDKVEREESERKKKEMNTFSELFKQIFNKYDIDQSGTIEVDELKLFL